MTNVTGRVEVASVEGHSRNIVGYVWSTISYGNSLNQKLVGPFLHKGLKRSEIGLYKAVVLVNRLNVFWGLDWQAVPKNFEKGTRTSEAHIVIGCVDTRAARALIRNGTSDCNSVDYWLDIGNNADSGQFVLGEPLNETNRRSRMRLRTVAELYPEIADAELDNDGLPSCSAAEALERQEPFVNSTLAQHALALLARLFRYGMVSYHGGFINLSTGSTGRLSVDPSMWKFIRRHSRERMTLRADGHAA